MRYGSDSSFSGGLSSVRSGLGQGRPVEQQEPSTVNAGTQALTSSLRWVSEHVIPASVACYVAGYVILALHLGAFGVADFEVLHTRHVLTGLLFLFFLGCVLVPYRYLRAALRSADVGAKGQLDTFATVTAYSGLAVTYSVGIVSSLTAWDGANHPQIPEDVEAEGWSRMLAAIKAASTSFAFVLMVYGLFWVGWRAADIVLRRFRKIQTVASDSSPEAPPKASAGVSFKSMFAFSAFLSLTSFAGEMRAFPSQIGRIQTVTSVEGGWVRFLAAALGSYLVCGGLLLTALLSQEMAGPAGRPESRPARRLSGNTWLLALLVPMILGTYARWVFPVLPPQAGGGGLVRVDVALKAGSTPTWPDQARLFLVDRNSEGLLLVAVDAAGSRQTVEVPRDEIASVSYPPAPAKK